MKFQELKKTSEPSSPLSVKIPKNTPPSGWPDWLWKANSTSFPKSKAHR